MPTTILQSSVGAGKTEAALQRLTHTINDPSRPFAQAWVLLATKRQEVAFRQRMVDLQNERSVYFNAEFFNFYELNNRLLNLAGQPPRRMSESSRIGLLRHLIRQQAQQSQLQNFGGIAETPGFLRIVADLIYELKQNLVIPETYMAVAATQKDRELAHIYDVYQRIVQDKNLVDREGEGWLALAEARDHPSLARNVALLLVDGYDQFTPVQAEMLALLSQRVGDLVITLTSVPDREDTIGKRFSQAYERLFEAHQKVDATLVIEGISPQRERHRDLIILGRNIFTDERPHLAQGAVHMIEVPEPQQEVAAVLRHVKRLLLDGTQPDDIMIALRDWPRYYTYFEMLQRAYQLPLLLHYSQPLATNPAMTVLLDLLQLSGRNPDAPNAYKRRQLLDVLRSPYVQFRGLDNESINLLDRISQEKRVLYGQSNWLQAIEHASQRTVDENGEEYDPLITHQQASDLSILLEDFFAHTQPKTEDTLLGYVEWLETLIGQDEGLTDPETAPDEPQPSDTYTLSMPQCIRHTDDDRLIARDVAALSDFKDLLRGMLTTQEFMERTFGAEATTITWQTFLDDVLNGVEQGHPASRNPDRSGRVLVTTATEARGLPHQHVFILGLAEGVFPAELSEDPIYLDREREALTAKGVPLQTQAERADDDGIFYELISLPRRSLTLSRPTVQDGKPWVESHLWRMVAAVFENLPIETIKIGQVVPASEVTSLNEAILAVADGLNNDDPDSTVLDVYNWLDSEHTALWSQIVQGRQTEAKRLSDTPHNTFTGKLEYPELIAHAEQKLGSRYKWSASQLNEFGLCPYRFFAKRMLKLEAVEEPEEGFDVLQLGTLNHAILEHTYQEIINEELTIAPKNQGIALEIFDVVAPPLLKSAPEQYGFRASALWEEEQVVIKRQLRSLIETDFSEEAPLNQFGKERVPYALEMKFGLGGVKPVYIAVGGETIAVRGSIDRVDRIGNQLIVMDYKTGSSGISLNEISAGRNFQMMVYMLALEQLIQRDNIPYTIAGGAFWHISNQSLSGKMDFNKKAEKAQAAIEDGQRHIAKNLVQARSGDFSVTPSKIEQGKCARYCDYYQLCRLANTYQRKQ